MARGKNKPVPYEPNVRISRTIGRFWRRFKAHPEDLEPFLAYVKKTTGASEEALSSARLWLLAWREFFNDDLTTYPVDIYLTTGVGALDLVLLAVLLPMGVTDQLLFIAQFALAVSLVLTGSSLVIRFMNANLGITEYRTSHSFLMAGAMVSGAVALVAAFLHGSVIIGVALAALLVVAGGGCGIYGALAHFLIVRARVFQAAKSSVSGVAHETAKGGVDTNRPTETQDIEAD